MERLAELDPVNAEWHRNLNFCRDRLQNLEGASPATGTDPT